MIAQCARVKLQLESDGGWKNDGARPLIMVNDSCSFHTDGWVAGRARVKICSVNP